MLISHFTENKMKHSYGVACYMHEHARDYGLASNEMFVLGLLHDIGYLYGTQDHPVTGARLLSSMGFDHCESISWHGTTPNVYKGLTTLEPPKELQLLWEADLSVDHEGNIVGFEKRLKDIEIRYGLRSMQYSDARETIEWLLNNGGSKCED